MQKLLIIERNTKEELHKAIEKNVLQEKNMRLVSFSVLEQIRSTQYNVISISLEKSELVPKHTYFYEAWCIIAVPDKTDEFYKDITGMSE